MRENQNIAHCSVCSEKTHCRFSFPNIPHRLNSTESKFHSFLSLNLPNNMGDIWKILIQNGCNFITHSPTISNQRTVKGGDAGSKTKSCFESDKIAGVSKHSSLELDCKLDPHNRSKQKWTTTTKFNTYQECSGRKGYRLIKKCPGNSVFWNVLQCCVDIMDFPCKSNCIKPVQRCIHLKN